MTSPAHRQDRHETEFFAFMRGSHHVLDALYEKLLAAVTAEDRVEMRAIWRELESKLLSHFEAEERYILPTFARADRKEAVDLVVEHGKIRTLLLEMGVAIDLHYARLEPFQKFIAALREHANREDTLLYRWASTMLDPELAAAAARHVTALGAT